MKRIAVTGGKATGKTTLMKHIERQDYSTVSYASILKYALSSQKTATLFSTKKDTEEIKRKIEIDMCTAGSNKTKKILIPLFISFLKWKFLISSLLGKEAIFVEMPFLYECELEERFDKVIIVTCGPKTQEERIEASYADAAHALKVAAAQIPLPEKRKKCDVVIDNNRSIEHTYYQIDTILANERKHSVFFIFTLIICALACVIPFILTPLQRNRVCKMLFRAKAEAKKEWKWIISVIISYKQTCLSMGKRIYGYILIKINSVVNAVKK